ncbi:hypothetical protein AZI86_01355 [Bdellovibrio bacteriovorus]|uniref:Uncharacterized protein n=1 Tax=Bdellovibrio bacteriovorus TaxID=959 RepID=A0A150WMN4_BDEBC|nr:hypothetical protein [Bdellovibrio bacteriovorus]KYG65751.1 hypothetical protein AZI86_01355 [Bdellovibrio bacteriovorus]
MKKQGLFLALFLVAGFFVWNFFFPLTQPNQDKRNPASTNAGYCIALRGNGEAQPAHWGALARSVEQLGLPNAMAGGSSATISMFLLESMASHPMVRGQNIQVQKERASLLLKSMVGFFGEVQRTDSWNDFKTLFGMAKNLKEGDVLNNALSLVSAKQFQQARSVINHAVQLGLFDVNSLRPLFIALQKNDVKTSQFYIRELMDSVQTFGSFNAQSPNLFFRAGIVNFDQAAKTFGSIAGFYALNSGSGAQVKNWQKFFDSCQKDSMGLSWTQIVQKNPKCAAHFSELFREEFSRGPKEGYEEQRIGSQFQVYPTTAILTGVAVSEFREAQLDYHRQLSPQFGAKFYVTNPDDVRFGYWGDAEDLQGIEDALNMNDEKSRRFVSLGSTTWRQVLALSPAEPGLSPLREFTTEAGKEFVSAGGWSDLHPVQVLKAAGCQNVLYITRQGAESVFAQGIAKRLFGFDRDWSEINNKEDSRDQTSLWSYLYNLGNPHSSISQALNSAGAVMCTNWNEFPVQTKFMELVEDSYRASYWLNPQEKSGMFSKLQPSLNEKRMGCAL